jgi:hypothetical protein
MGLVSPLPGGEPMTIERPIALLLFGLLPLIGCLAWTSRARLAGGRRLVSALVRVAGVTAVVLAIAGPGAADNLRDTTVFVLDVSDSVLLAEQALQRAWVEDAIAAAADGSRVAVVEFGIQARATRLPAEIREFAGLAPGADFSGGTGGSDLAGAITRALALIGADGTGRIVLLTDGRAPPEGMDVVLARATDAGVPISFVPTRLPERTDTALESVQAPAYASPGRPFAVRVVAVAQREADIRLRLWAGDRLAADTRVQVQPGVNPLGTRVTAEKEGPLILRAEILDDADALTGNNVAGAIVRVLPPPRILLVGDPTGTATLAAVLGVQGFETTELAAARLPGDATALQPFAAVVLADVPASALSAPQVAALATFVRDRGHGLVVTGGPNSFGPGGYEGTALEELLPVRSRPPDEEEQGLALVLVLDRSASMSLVHGDDSKIALAREAAIQTVGLLEPGDQIGVLAFAVNAVWVVPPTRIESPEDIAVIEAQIRAIGIAGSTDIYTAVQTARRRMTGLTAGLKHMILITDGQASYGDFRTFSSQVRRDGISVSAVAIGNDADTELLEELARSGNGRYYATDDASSIPALLTQETEIARSFFLVDRRHQPRVANASAVFADVAAGESVPYLGGFVRVSLRPEATAVLVSDSNDPILATWQLGFGRVAVWTSNFADAWTDEWREWGEFTRFAGGLADWTVAGGLDRQAGLRVGSRADGDRVTVIVDSVDTEGRFRNGLPTTGLLTTPEGEIVELVFQQTAPGRYEATLAAAAPGAYGLVLEQGGPDGAPIGPVEDGFVVPYSIEFQPGRSGKPLLEAIADRTGGATLTDVARATGDNGLVAAESLVPLLLTVGMLLFVVDVAVRRLRTGRAELREQYRDVLEWFDHHHPGRVAAMITRRVRQGRPGSG